MPGVLQAAHTDRTDETHLVQPVARQDAAFTISDMEDAHCGLGVGQLFDLELGSHAAFIDTPPQGG